MSTWRATLPALWAALLFGAATPAAKVLVRSANPQMLAGLLYLGAGCALAVVVAVRRAPSGLTRRDLPWLAGGIAAGGILGPVALLWGLARTPASTASLLLSLEAVLTALLALVFFGEHVGRRTWTALSLVTAGGIVVAGGSPEPAHLAGAGAVGLACFAWALDNNLTREIAHADARWIALWKGTAAGLVNVTGAWLAGAALPEAGALAGALVTGALGYGVSLAFYVTALRQLGAARTGGWFATAPFIGAVLGVGWLGELLTVPLVLAGALMAGGTWLMLSERHRHRHRHETLEHRHAHVHDEHHRHEHAGDEGPEPHVHLHRHEEIEHDHPHVPDLHHRHSH